MPKYIKSHSNYVLKKKHQDIYDGTIWERDITTIGGVNQFARGQVPIFKDSNFIITVRDDGKVANQYNRMKWKSNESGDTWTLSDVSGLTSDFEEQNDLKIVLKQDYYDFCDFAYYGSLNELFRSSINDIISRFPGEMYGTDKNAFYTEKTYIDGETYSEDIMLGGEDYKVLLNPFGIDIYSKTKPMDGLDIKYFANEGYKNYVIIKEDGSEEEITGWEPELPEDPCLIPCNCNKFKAYGNGTIFPSTGGTLVVGTYTVDECITIQGISCDKAWASVSYENGKIIATVTENTETLNKEATVTITANTELESGCQKSIKFYQRTKSCNCDGVIIVPQRTVTLPSSSGTNREIGYFEPDECATYGTISCDEEWITVEPQGSHFKITRWDLNESTSRSCVATLSVELEDGKVCTEYVTIRQSAGCNCGNDIHIPSERINADGHGQSGITAATYSVDGCVREITATPNRSWVSTRISDGKIILDIEKNSSRISRDAFVRINAILDNGVICSNEILIIQDEGCKCEEIIDVPYDGYEVEYSGETIVVATYQESECVSSIETYLDPNCDWIRVSSGNGEIKIDVYPNEDLERDSYLNILVFTIDGYCPTNTITIHQLQENCSCRNFVELVTDESIRIQGSGETNVLVATYDPSGCVTGISPYITSQEYSWINLHNDTENGKIYISVWENPSTQDERTGYVQFSGITSDEGNHCSLPRPLVVIQNKQGCSCDELVILPHYQEPIKAEGEDNYVVGAYNINGCFDLSNNKFLIYIEEGSDWCNYRSNRDTGEIILSAMTNNSTEIRSGSVYVSAVTIDGEISCEAHIPFSQEARECDCNNKINPIHGYNLYFESDAYPNYPFAGYNYLEFDELGAIITNKNPQGDWINVEIPTDSQHLGGVFLNLTENTSFNIPRTATVVITGITNDCVCESRPFSVFQNYLDSDTCINLISGSSINFNNKDNEGVKIAEICDGVSCMVDVEEDSWMNAYFSSSTNEVYLNLSRNFKEIERSNYVYIKIKNGEGEVSPTKTIEITQDQHICSCEEIGGAIEIEEDSYTFEAIPCTDAEGDDWCVFDNIVIAQYDKSEYDCREVQPFCCNYGVSASTNGSDWFECEEYQIDDARTIVKLTKIKKNYSSDVREGNILIIPSKNGSICERDVKVIPIKQLGNSSITTNSFDTTNGMRLMGLRGGLKNSSLAKANGSSPGEEKIRRLTNVTITTNVGSYEVGVYLGDNNQIVYLSQNTQNIHIRPKQEFLDKFYNECDNFERLLLNPKTTPKYKAIFSVINENDKGYYRKMEEFVFPTSEGGYNLDASTYGFTDYTTRLSEIGTYYDGYFTDNLYRSMTHEAIKNFDWSFTREFIGEGEEEYTHGGEKIQKALRIFAREFDEILSYINNIKNNGRITYDERSNVPNYFLIDEAEDCGWDVCVTYPYDLVEYKVSGNSKSEVEDYNEDTQLSGYTDGKLVRNFSHNPSSKIYPYSESHISGTDISDYDRGGYFVVCDGSGDVPCYYYQTGSSIYSYISASGSGTTYYDESLGGTPMALKNRIKTYSDEKEYTYFDANNEFIRRLRINSPYIWRHKGTIEGIEMLLSLFGMKSKRWVDNMGEKGCSDYEYDYDITEYSSFTPRIEEQWDAEHQMYRIDWINSTKAIVYDYRQTSNYTRYGANQSNYVSYQGLPIAFRDEYIINVDDTLINKPYIKIAEMNTCSGQGATNDSGEAFTRMDTNEPVRRRYLYPNFSKTEQLDGNPYFQMSGGWLAKTVETSGDITSRYNFQFDVDDNIAYTSYVENGYVDRSGEIIDNHPIYKETVRNIKRVDNIAQLVSTPSFSVEDGTIYYVSNIERDAAIINGEVYTINYEYGGDENDNLRYVVLTKNGGYISIGDDLFFDNSIMVYDKNGSATTYDVSDKPEGFDIKAYIIKEDGQSKFMCQADADGYYTIDGFCVLDEVLSESGMTNYFIIDDAYYSTRMYCGSGDSGGWRALRESDPEYIRINTITNYYEGNNPHNGNMVYDGGHEYFTYYKRLFKYAIDNSLFDERCYESFFIDLDNEISKIGFHGLIDDNEMIRQYYPFMNEDSKIHYFGTYYKRDEEYVETYTNNVVFYGENEEKAEKLKGMYQSTVNSDIEVVNYILSDDALIGGGPYPSATTYNCSITDDEGEEHLIPISAKTDEVTNQIVNNKRLTITFYLHDTWYSNRGQCELKYIDDIVMNYLTQMVPSTSIVDVRYVGKNNG